MKPALSYVLVLILILCLMLPLAACKSGDFTEDYVERYRDFLDYSLGADNWQVVDSGRELCRSGGPGYTSYYLWWSIGYTDAQGVYRQLELNNENSYTTHDGYFSMLISITEREIIQSRLSQAILPRYQEPSAEVPMQL